MLSSELATFLSGRYIEFKVYSLTYAENFWSFINLTSAGWSLYEAREKFEQHCYERTFEYLAEFSEKEIEVVCRILDRMNQTFELDIEDSKM